VCDVASSVLSEPRAWGMGRPGAHLDRRPTFDEWLFAFRLFGGGRDVSCELAVEPVLQASAASNGSTQSDLFTNSMPSPSSSLSRSKKVALIAHDAESQPFAALKPASRITVDSGDLILPFGAELRSSYGERTPMTVRDGWAGSGQFGLYLIAPPARTCYEHTRLSMC
jgi:hypothetical protein